MGFCRDGFFWYRRHLRTLGAWHQKWDWRVGVGISVGFFFFFSYCLGYPVTVGYYGHFLAALSPSWVRYMLDVSASISVVGRGLYDI